MGNQVPRVDSRDGLRPDGGWRMMSSWQGGAFRHASTATSEDSKPAEEVAEGITLTDNCIRVRVQSMLAPSFVNEDTRVRV